MRSCFRAPQSWQTKSLKQVWNEDGTCEVGKTGTAQIQSSATNLEGRVSHEFDAVRESFITKFEQDQENGAAVAVYHRGVLVVDRAGGMRDGISNAAYSRKMGQRTFSPTKRITAFAANMLSDQGRLKSRGACSVFAGVRTARLVRNARNGC